ncbi:uncharacterized protein LOC110037850 [Phalaenopsis equestris]|uniref:uncharacterized protein LOC110036842 n=1 Tax=Phalaenopsis equestris TaxID=78828 RepID=UPI0009E5F21D|nr:uncharacterized protein LOC110036842 [Phalaenopsis equestris]XP_020598239.1 uncharacterized protein LOC110037850 [Phalaenopsis equestris]
MTSSMHPRSLLLPYKISPPTLPPPSLSRSYFQWPKRLRPPSPALFRPHYTYRRLLTHAINLPAENPGDPTERLNLDSIVSHAHKLFDDLPQPVKKFPWAKALESFFRLVFELACTVARYLSMPVLAVSSLSEMSYCGHEKKLALMPFPFLIGFALAGVLSDTAIELSVGLKEGDLPWHLLMVATFFLLLKLPGPYYPYWGRLLVPHFANGGLWRTLWLIFLWYRRAGRTGVQTVPSGRDGSS